MAILSHISVTSAAVPISQDSSTTQPTIPPPIPNPRQTKVLLPKKKPLKWSTGVAPGEYGGPPTTSKLRKYWGGEDEDPLTSDEFIWNKDFMGRMKSLIQDPNEPSLEPTPEESSGFLSLNRVMSLDSLEVDLSKELTRPSKPTLKKPVDPATKGSSSMSRKWRLVPTHREQEKWDKATKAATGGSVSCLQNIAGYFYSTSTSFLFYVAIL
uniref:Uncharacterized protein n=1 Tax=Rhizophora mucronata TaxID=61149 RepID=A0A2P2IZ58_RHIMU